jgi:membrane fusion protein (multidrug efflux system)
MSICVPGRVAAATPRGVAAVLFLAAAALSGCSRGQPEAPAPPPPIKVTVIDASPKQLPLLLEAVGQSEGSKQVDVRARVSGILEHTLYREGEQVRSGATLFQIDREPYRIAVEQARAALAQERARLEQTEREANRLKALAADRSISQREYDDADSAFKTERAAVDAAVARLSDAELNLAYTDVKAPIGGVRGRALRSDGNLITLGTDSAMLTTIAQTDPIWVRFALSDRQFASLRAEGGKEGSQQGRQQGATTRVKIVLPDGTTYRETGKLNFTASTVDDRLGTVQLRAEFPNPSLAVLPGQYVRVQVYTGEQNAAVVPQVAIVQNDRGRFVWVVGPDAKAQLRPVETGAWVGADWLVFKGLAAGDRVIVDNLIKLRPGSAVDPQPATAAPSTAPAPAQPAAPGKSAT